MAYTGPDRRKVYRGGKPPCPKCGHDESRVIDSGPDYVEVPEDVYARQRRCKLCDHRWFTYEQNCIATISGSTK